MEKQLEDMNQELRYLIFQFKTKQYVIFIKIK